MSGLSIEEASIWRIKFQRLVTSGYSERVKCIDPTYHFMYSQDEHKEDGVEKEAMSFDTYWVRNSDIIVANMNNLSSIGTAQELMLAYELDKPIIIIVKEDDLDKLHFWIKEEASKIIIWKNDMSMDDVLEATSNYIWGHYI